MRAVIQRCRRAQVEVEGKVVGTIERGLAIFLGVAEGDDEACAARLAQKIAALRIFDDDQGKFAFSLRDIRAAALVVPNFTVCGDARKGTRPNFGGAAAPDPARRLYERFVTLLSTQDVPVQTGVFAASMSVTVENDGPVTLVINVEP